MVKGIRILLAGDAEGVLQGLSSLLRTEEDITVVGLSLDSAEAVGLAERLSPDLAILDVTMPLMNGIEATRRLRALLPSTRILIVSAQTSPCYVSSALKAGADGYVAKDAVGRELITAIRAVVGGHGYVSEALRPDRLD
jgi:two-component system nitrate/nitrite response regulator NarL